MWQMLREHSHIWRFESSGILLCVDYWLGTYALKEHNAKIFRVSRYKKTTWWTVWPHRWRHSAPPECWYLPVDIAWHPRGPVASVTVWEPGILQFYVSISGTAIQNVLFPVVSALYFGSLFNLFVIFCTDILMRCELIFIVYASSCIWLCGLSSVITFEPMVAFSWKLAWQFCHCR
jgi:hypothetical protein